MPSHPDAKYVDTSKSSSANTQAPLALQLQILILLILWTALERFHFDRLEDKYISAEVFVSITHV